MENCLIHKEDEISELVYPLLIFVSTGRNINHMALKTEELKNNDEDIDKTMITVSMEDRLKYFQLNIDDFDNVSVNTDVKMILKKEDDILKSILKDMKSLVYSGPKQDNVRKYWILKYFYCLLKRDKTFHCLKLSQAVSVVCSLIENVDDYKVIRLCFEYINLAIECCYPAIYHDYVCTCIVVYMIDLLIYIFFCFGLMLLCNNTL